MWHLIANGAGCPAKRRAKEKENIDEIVTTSPTEKQMAKPYSRCLKVSEGHAPSINSSRADCRSPAASLARSKSDGVLLLSDSAGASSPPPPSLGSSEDT